MANFRLLAIVILTTTAVACKIDPLPPRTNYDADTGNGTGAGGAGTTGTGGTTGTAGATATGGVGSRGGAGGTSRTGGTVNTGVSKATGGIASTGGTTSIAGTTGAGGAIATGGSTATGGASTNGGASATGGSKATGGIASTGGTTSIGGTTSAGGVIATGGTTANGGVSTNGGASAAGGTTSTGGSAGTRGYGIPGQSCNGITGMECNGESCCTSLPVPGGTFPMGRGTETCSNCTAGCPGGMTCDADEIPEHNVTVSAFLLDKYEVTVGRFHRFVDAYDTIDAPPPANGGAHPNIAGTGWQAVWNGNLPADASQLQQHLACDSGRQTWGRGNDVLPINCVSWYEAFAFCIWDGGRLPTEAEWEYAAAGGSDNRVYPWGSSPVPSCTLAAYLGCLSAVPQVGSYRDGGGRWGHLDLVGSLWQWVFDWYSSSWYSGASATGSDVANMTPSVYRALRGGSWDYFASDYLRAASRHMAVVDPTFRHDLNGIRCAR